MPIPQLLPPIASQPLSVVLLADDPAHVEPAISAWTLYLDGRGQEYELILALHGLAHASAVTASHPRVRVSAAAGPAGEGTALRAALALAGQPLLFCSLCRPEYRPEFLGLLLDAPAQPPAEGKLIDQVHFLAGYRATVRVPLGLRIVGWMWRMFCRVVFSYSAAPLPGWLGLRNHAGWLLMRILFGLRQRDVSCPVRLMRREILARIPIQSESNFVHVEILAKANFLGCLTVEETPLPAPPTPSLDDFRLLWRDGKRMFTHPDFGPPVLLAPPAGPDPAGQ